VIRNPSILSVIIATFNSAAKLPLVLESLRSQDFPQVRLDVMVIDGGSTDNTREIASRFGARVLDNPQTNPGAAKFIGLHQCLGKIALFVDSDEVYCQKTALKNIVATFAENPQLHLVTSSGYRSPDGYPFINRYINEFGDPFSCFIYRLSKDYRFYLPTMRKRYRVTHETESFAVFDLAQAHDLPLIEMYAMGSSLDVDFFAREFPTQFNSPTEFSHAFNIVMTKSTLLGIAKGAEINHYSSDSVKTFLHKVKWRIKSNIVFPEFRARGFLGRQKYQATRTKVLTYAYLPYCLLVFPAFLDALWMSVTRRDLAYMGHLPLSLYTALSILYFKILHTLGWRPKVSAYGTSIKVAETVKIPKSH
jgi:glycosyltransferase involved in cell wall biosynthesis